MLKPQLNKPVKILCVEDEKDLVNIYQSACEKNGYVFMATADIAEAQNIAQRENPDLILLDLILPLKVNDLINLTAKQGFDFLERIKKTETLNKIPVIVLTNLNTIDDRERARKLGAVDYIIKADILPKEICTKIKEYLNLEN